MRLATHKGVITGAVAIALAIAAPAASARFELNRRPTRSDQATSASPPVRPNPGEQTAHAGGSRARLSSRTLRPPDLAALDRAQVREAKALVANLVRPTRSGNATPGPAVFAAPSLGTASGGFDWGDGAIGAGVAGLIVLLLAAGHLAVRQRRHPRHP
jgi:hypothetical protein